MSIAELYQQHKLQPSSKCIRVLDVLPISSAVDEPLRCALSIVDLDNDPTFAALSYVWGNDPPTPQYFVHCGNVDIQVTKNCHSALQHLRKKLGSFAIWVDAICINQADSDENGEKTW
jgi:hypothetical protein